MFSELAKAALTVLFFGCAVMAFYCGINVFRCVINAARERKPEVSLIVAIRVWNILFHPELYKPESRKWADRYTWCVIGTTFFIFAGMGIGLLMQWLGNEPVGLRSS